MLSKIAWAALVFAIGSAGCGWHERRDVVYVDHRHDREHYHHHHDHEWH